MGFTQYREACFAPVFFADVVAVGARIICDKNRFVVRMESADLGLGSKGDLSPLGGDF